MKQDRCPENYVGISFSNYRKSKIKKKKSRKKPERKKHLTYRAVKNYILRNHASKSGVKYSEC